MKNFSQNLLIIKMKNKKKINNILFCLTIFENIITIPLIFYNIPEKINFIYFHNKKINEL